jgi:hypothetical protein
MAVSEIASLNTENLSRLSISSQKSGEPRMDPTIRLLHRFYEPLVLLMILDPTRGVRNTNLVPDSRFDTSQDLRRKFLDQLSWTCDYKHGGETVSAIVAEANPQGTTFWLAANINPKQKTLSHLEWILKQLEASSSASEQETEELRNEITARCIEFSKDKVKNYCRQLCFLIRKCVEILANQSDQQGLSHVLFRVRNSFCRLLLLTTSIADARLLEDLQKLEALRESHVELCSLAYSFRNSTLLETLNQRHLRSGTTAPLWSELRHYIGRLGSWSKASKVLLRAAKMFPNLLHDFHVEYLESPPPIPVPSTDKKTNLDSALGRMIPKAESQRLQDVREAVRNFTVKDISAEFTAKYTDKTFKPRVHAELLLLEHFYHKNLRFVENDRYIGCSKPSCYCCDLYMKCHPGGFMTRACHGNLWIKWRAPDPPIDNDEQARKHTAKMLNEMVKTVRRDAIGQLLSKQPRRRRVPDSTTGMSTAIPDLTAILATLNPVGNNRTPNNSLDSAN